MKIGIYGDSYAAIRHPSSQNFSWPKLISAYYPTVMFSLIGSNFFYSYEKLLKTYSHVDQCILILTNPMRIKLNDSVNIGPGLRFAHSIRPEQDFRQVIDPMTIEALKATDYYYKYLYDYNYMHEVQHGLVERLLTRIPNLLMIPAFPNSYCGDPFVINTQSISLYDISCAEENHWKIKKMDNDCRECHLSIENNIILKDIILENLGRGIIELDKTRFNLMPEYKEWYYDNN